MAGDGSWPLLVDESGVLPYPMGSQGARIWWRQGWMCAQHQGTPHSEGNKGFSRLTFLGIVPLEVPYFLAHCFPFSLVFEDGHPTCGLWLIKLHLCCARVWLHLVDGWWRWGVCGENTGEGSSELQAGHNSQSCLCRFCSVLKSCCLYPIIPARLPTWFSPHMLHARSSSLHCSLLSPQALLNQGLSSHFPGTTKGHKRGQQGFKKGGIAIRGAHLLGQGWIPETPVQCGSLRCSCSFQNHFQSPGSPWERRNSWFTCPGDDHSLRPLFIGLN